MKRSRVADARSAALGRGPVIARDDLGAFAANIEKIATDTRTVQ